MIDFKFSHQETAEIQKAKDQVSYLARDNFSPSENKPWFFNHIFAKDTYRGRFFFRNRSRNMGNHFHNGKRRLPP